MAKKISDHILSILSKFTVDGNNIFLTCGQLDRKDYAAINEVLENMGGKWNKKFKAHVFDSDPTEKLEDVLLLGEITNKKQEYGFFPTPPELAKRVVDLADIKQGHFILEPSAGHGALVDAITYVGKEADIVCLDIQPENVKILKEKGYDTRLADFLGLIPLSDDATPDRIIMNPPFSNQQDIKHVMKAWDILADGGILVSIMTPAFTFRENKLSLEFRNLVEEHGWYEKNPEGSFKQSGTNVNTVIVVLKK